MKRISLLFLLIIPLLAFSQSADIHKVWIEFDTYKNGQNGMTIHADFTTHYCKGHRIRAIAYFYDYEKDKLMQRSSISINRSANGQFCVGETDPHADYEHCHYNDFDIFVAISSIPFYQGKHTYYILVDVLDMDTDTWLTDNRDYISFIGTSGSNSDNSNIKTPSPPVRYDNTPLPCVGCGGTKRCSVCGGKGYTASYSVNRTWHQCGGCGGTGICQACRFQ